VKRLDSFTKATYRYWTRRDLKRHYENNFHAECEKKIKDIAINQCFLHAFEKAQKENIHSKFVLSL